MNKLLILILSLFFLNNCSLNENSRIWKDKENDSKNPKDIRKLFSEKKIVTQFNQELKLDLVNVKINNKVIDNKNNYGFQDYSGSINKVGNYKFSKLENVNNLNFKPLFLNDGLIFLRFVELFSLSFQIREFSFKEQLFKKNNDIIKINNLFTQISIQSFFSL